MTNFELTKKVENLIPGQVAGRTLEHAVVVLVRVQHIPGEQNIIMELQIHSFLRSTPLLLRYRVVFLTGPPPKNHKF